MTITDDKNTPEISGKRRQFNIKGNTLIYGGSIVVVDRFGNAHAGKSTIGMNCVGIAEERADASKGDKTVTVKTGIFGLMKKSGENITHSNIGSRAYIVDEQTVSIVGTNRSSAGIIFDVSGDILWIKMTK